jgi:hypothetical protein
MTDTEIDTEIEITADLVRDLLPLDRVLKGV